MQVSRLRRGLYWLIREFGFLVTALLAPAILLLWLVDVLKVSAGRSLLGENKPYPRLRDGVKVEWE
jgi:hypothetical protein